MSTGVALGGQVLTARW